VEFVNLPGAGLGGIPLNFCGVAIEIIRNYPGEIIFILRIAKKTCKTTNQFTPYT
jgi:hypothetical protein